MSDRGKNINKQIIHQYNIHLFREIENNALDIYVHNIEF